MADKEKESIKKCAEIQLGFFMGRLKPNDDLVLSKLDQNNLALCMARLVLIRPGQGELDIFCGYHKKEEPEAVFLSLHPGMPVMLLEKETIRERIENAKKQDMLADQSVAALAGWPTSS